jgi:hypothetical protein
MEMFPCSRISRINIVKMAILPKATSVFFVIPIKILPETEKINLKVHTKAQKSLNR